MALEHTIRTRGKLMDFSCPRVMGILNITPDSFSDGGKFLNPEKAVERASEMLAEGAEILDLGAVSSRPGAADVSEQEELRRLIPVLEMLMKRHPGVLVSVDTFRASVAEIALAEGACIINDITGGAGDPRMADVVAAHGAPLILMHMKGTPQTMQQNPQYSDVVQEVAYFFSERIKALRLSGVKDIILDPGFGFGKTPEHNYTLARNFAAFQMFDLPLLAGISRKRMLYGLTGVSAEETKPAAAGLHMHLLQSGAAILRVHDVADAVQCVKVFRALQGQFPD